MLYELRIYYIHPGRMQAINDRFANHTLNIFSRIGMKVTDFWEDTDAENNKLVYVLEFANREERDAKFEIFRNDPEWQKARNESELDGAIVERVESVFLKQAAYFNR